MEISFLRMVQFDEKIVRGQQFGVGGSNSAEKILKIFSAQTLLIRSIPGSKNVTGANFLKQVIRSYRIFQAS